MSVPLSSMIKMASLSSEEILAINPNEVRVRLSITEPVELQTKNVRLALQFEHYDGSHSEYKYLLEIIDVKRVSPITSWFFSEPLKHAYQFKLAKLSQLEFNKYQKNYTEKGKPKYYHWTVYYHLKNKPMDDKKIEIDVELKFSEQDDYFYLLKSAPVEIASSQKNKK